MLTLDKLRKVYTKAQENNEYMCMVSGNVYEIFKPRDDIDVDDFISHYGEELFGEERGVTTKEFSPLYTDADHAKDWNYFKAIFGA